jgi:hypothetical protein
MRTHYSSKAPKREAFSLLRYGCSIVEKGASSDATGRPHSPSRASAERQPERHREARVSSLLQLVDPSPVI